MFSQEQERQSQKQQSQTTPVAGASSSTGLNRTSIGLSVIFEVTLGLNKVIIEWPLTGLSHDARDVILPSRTHVRQWTMAMTNDVRDSETGFLTSIISDLQNISNVPNAS